MQLDVSLTRMAQGTNVPRLCRSMHISALAANIEYWRFVAVQYALIKGFVQIIKNHFVPFFYFCHKFEKSGDVLKTFFFRILCKGGIDSFVFLTFVVRGVFKTFRYIPPVKGIAGVKIYIIKIFAAFVEFFEKSSRVYRLVFGKNFYRVGKGYVTLFVRRACYKLISHSRLAFAGKTPC